MLSCSEEPFTAFVRDLQIHPLEVHLYKGPNVFGGIMGNEHAAILMLEEWEDENLYFLAGCERGLTKRAADHDVKMRGMFTLDFDIRKELEKKGLSSDDNFVQMAGESILSQLISHDGNLSRFRYAVLSGNGMHVHYFGNPVEVKKDEWVAGMKVIFEKVNNICQIPCDTGCGNAGRIMRMPGSWNVKNGKKPVEFIAWNPVGHFDMDIVQALGQKHIAEAALKKAQTQAEFEARGEKGSDVIALINQIPIEQVVKQLPLGITSWREKKDGGLRFSDEKGVERGFFKHKTYNVVVHEGTSLFPAAAGVGYNGLGLVKVVLGVSTPEAIKWFCDRSTPVREAAEREKAEWVAAQAPKEISFIDDLLPSL